ncbi:hypothetical protein B0A49_01976 [Cryomyces minteri]|uniref:N-acetyltransferase domain-containing protein n=1 Tax=Cryomyces minteri TaxID=331657 RepID=A0A4U0XIR6_9PEZI|nr:hypothetical protein B0A49_01976 [Cryomyces minteri]
MTTQITHMREEDIDGAIDTIQQAFAEDPYNNWFSTIRNRVSLGIRCRWGLQHALFYVAKDAASSTPDKVIGTAMWLPPSPPSAPRSWPLYLASWSLWLQQVRMNLYYGRGGLNTKRYWIWKAAQHEAQSGLWTDERGYYFCNIVTVLPECQGRGIGRALFEVVMRRADEEGVNCYLESSRAEPNMRIYERMGFKLAREMLCDDDGDAIKLFCMMREPKRRENNMQADEARI